MNKSEKTCIIFLGSQCNNNCLMCSIKNAEKMRTKQDVFADMESGIKNSFKNLEFTGGEPTVRKDFFDLVHYAKKLGYENIAISSNGRMLSYKKFSQKTVQAGVNKVTLSVLGSNSKIHDSLSRTPGSFNELIQGLRNVKKLNIKIIISTVVNKINYLDIPQIAKLLNREGIGHWNLLDLIPSDNALTNYSSLVVEPHKLSEAIMIKAGLFKKFEQLNYFDFPFCFFQKNYLKSSKIMLINTKRICYAEQIGLEQKRFTAKHRDDLKEYIEPCLNCEEKLNCGGIWPQYKSFFEKEIIELNEKSKSGKLGNI